MLTSVDAFVNDIVESGASYDDMDRIYVQNKILALVGDENPVEAADQSRLAVVDALIETAINNGKIEDTQSAKDILNAQLMDLVTPIPSVVNERFWSRYQVAPEKATDWFYDLSQRNDYIKTRAIAKNVVFDTATDYGDIEITINLSKPEKDPKDIAAARNQPQTGYPMCALCMENEGYLGRPNSAARSSHRIIRFQIGGETWGFQYSPYAYFTEHAIFLNKMHTPMVINTQTFSNLLEIVTMFPSYFVGSNADLPIVGGSVLTHEHYQGGRHQFPMMKAKIAKQLNLNLPDVQAGIVKWPMSTIRLRSQNRSALVSAASVIHNAWVSYSDESVNVRALTNGERHHTTTPIAYRDGKDYILDIVLRDNQTSKEYPDGIFHPHQDVQHIKKENIGLIEVMGRAILPARLKTEMVEVQKYVLGQPNNMAPIHQEWADQLKDRHQFTVENVTEILDQEIGAVFARVLEDAGVFKQNAEGQQAFSRFIKTI
ncbi:UDP-glucose--hexose-1-phosphate uridylyltransferase [Levilactobacillus bambusae]|uniref:Galactose-1-phosphate uridylyltransferase n=1 Tax=Levilactobacillus bambusae TaxID=2024736 RepID=A0A2V1N034_9LACO|nr:UDP-glucose--hexose-1-phosphate uridylyltransferase [Levilactobacillus bambusae]PWG00108.1 galactose-1-phosphate uridylyltransferase [Levilactobacillus bambusae]